MPLDPERQLTELLAVTKHSVKGLQRQCRQTLQLANELERRIEQYETSITARRATGGIANHEHHDEPQAAREGVSQLARYAATA